MKIELLQNFIVFEGLDGAGTTTQSKLLAQKLGAVHTFEPTDSAIGKLIRSILRGEVEVDQQTLVYLFIADRNQHVNYIKKTISEGQTVVCDRYLFSSLAYQSLSADFEFVYNLNKAFPLPETLFFIDTPINECQNRISKRNGNKEIFEGTEIQGTILSNYYKGLKLYGDNGFKYHVLDGLLPIDDLLNLELKTLKN